MLVVQLGAQLAEQLLELAVRSRLELRFRLFLQPLPAFRLEHRDEDPLAGLVEITVEALEEALQLVQAPGRFGVVLADADEEERGPADPVHQLGRDGAVRGQAVLVDEELRLPAEPRLFLLERDADVLLQRRVEVGDVAVAVVGVRVAEEGVEAFLPDQSHAPIPSFAPGRTGPARNWDSFQRAAIGMPCPRVRAVRTRRRAVR